MILVSIFAMRNPTARSSGALYWALVASIGAGLGLWLLVYTHPVGVPDVPDHRHRLRRPEPVRLHHQEGPDRVSAAS